MTQKHFIALADAMREHDRTESNRASEHTFTQPQIDMLADFCQAQNSMFNRERWLAYIAGNCGPSGGAIK